MFRELLRIKSKELKESRRMTFHQAENINTEIEIIKNEIEVLDFKSIITEMKNLVEGLNNRFKQLEEKNPQTWRYVNWIIQCGEQKEKKEWEKWSEPQNLVGHHQVYIFIMEIPEGEERERSRKNTWWNLWKLSKFSDKSTEVIAWELKSFWFARSRIWGKKSLFLFRAYHLHRI